MTPSCSCFAVEEKFWWSGDTDDVSGYRRARRLVGDVEFHAEPQDTDCDAWKKLLDLVEDAVEDTESRLPHRRRQAQTFAPMRSLEPAERARIVTLPPTIAKLKRVRRLDLYGSHLVRIPPEIGEMSSLEHFVPYTSHRLHWFPYEMTRCSKLRSSTVSTRVLYGNFKLRPPFPPLAPGTSIGECDSGPIETELSRRCSVCDRPFEDSGLHRVWISLVVATDVLPLLVHACSDQCVRRLPTPANGYNQEPHRGGLGVQQPPIGLVAVGL